MFTVVSRRGATHQWFHCILKDNVNENTSMEAVDGEDLAEHLKRGPIDSDGAYETWISEIRRPALRRFAFEQGRDCVPLVWSETTLSRPRLVADRVDRLVESLAAANPKGDSKRWIGELDSDRICRDSWPSGTGLGYSLNPIPSGVQRHVPCPWRSPRPLSTRRGTRPF